MKTKLHYLITGFIIVSLQINAGIPAEITIRQAFLAANHQLASLGKQESFTFIETREIMADEAKMAYVFDLDPAGYIVVGASTALPPVLAYSFESNFGEMEEESPLFMLVKADLSKQWAFSNTPGSSLCNYYESLWKSILDGEPGQEAGPLFEQWPATGDGWLKTNWTQSAPYNNFCPMDPVTGVRSYAGCPATAMAQIMNFHTTTNNTHFDNTDDYYHNYAGRQYWIDDDFETIDFPSFPELNAYLDTLNAHYLAGSALTNDDKAAMTFACGTAARQVYTSQGSGTFGVNQAYDAYLRFGCSLVALLDADDTDLYTRLRQNIIDTLPAHLAVVDESWSTGHNVVVDGYNTDDYYHLNFGWGGSYNGWYLIPEEIPYELTVIEGVVVDIMKKLPTGVDKSTDGGQRTAVHIYPNPANGLVVIEIPGDNSRSQIPGSKKQVAKTGTQISIFDLNGREILQRQATDSQISIDVSTLHAGIYLVKLVSDGSVILEKLVKQ